MRNDTILWPKHLHKKGDFKDTSLSAVSAFLKPFPKIIFKQGFFPQSAKGLSVPRFSFVHIDVDIYQSVLDSLNYFYPQMARGGVMLFDDYQWKDTPGVEEAIHEFFKDKPEKPTISAVYQCLIIKY